MDRFSDLETRLAAAGTRKRQRPLNTGSIVQLSSYQDDAPSQSPQKGSVAPRRAGKSGIDGLLAKARASAGTRPLASTSRVPVPMGADQIAEIRESAPPPASKRTSRWLSDNPLAAASHGKLAMSDRVARMWEGVESLADKASGTPNAVNAAIAAETAAAPLIESQPRPTASQTAASPSAAVSALPAAAAATSVKSLPPTAISRYEVLNRIAEGSYGTVYRARDRVTGDIVAIKQIKLDAVPRLEGFPTSAMREIFALTSLSHPLLLQLRAVASTSQTTAASSQAVAPAEFRGSNQVLMIMDFCDHDIKSFQQALGREFAEAEVKCLALQLLEALDCMHKHHMFHRDLKPANLLCTIDCHLRVADFGLAKRFHTPLVASTSPRFVVTPTYRAIELLLGDHHYGPALDVWSAGCIIAELLCGTQLFKASSEPELAVKIFSVLGLPSDETPAAAASAASAASASSSSSSASIPSGDEWPGWRKLPYVSALRGIRSLSASDPSKRAGRLRKHLGLPSRSITGRNCVSDAGIDLLLRMLALNPTNRLTAAEAMSHPWFQSTAPQPQRRDLMPHVPSTNENAMRSAHDDEAMSGFSTRGSAVEARRMLGLQNG